MNIVIIGNDGAFNEAKLKLGFQHQYSQAEVFTKELLINPVDVVFDFNSDWSTETATAYSLVTAPVFLNTTYSTLAVVNVKTDGSLFGFCGLPTFFNRPQLEVVSLDKNLETLESILKHLRLDYVRVKDQVGMVTPRVICMIINEAYEAFQQGVSTKEDIDLSMKLGTNYPYGPFEWANKIELANVAKLLSKLGQPLAFNVSEN